MSATSDAGKLGSDYFFLPYFRLNCITTHEFQCQCHGLLLMKIQIEGILIDAYISTCSGAQMVPISWQEMQCPVTFQKEFRKVAKVV